MIWPDPPEKHDNAQAWYLWVRHFSAAILALIDRHHPRLEPFQALWAEAVRDAFQSGAYDRQREIAALNVLMDGTNSWRGCWRRNLVGRDAIPAIQAAERVRRRAWQPALHDQ